MAYGKEINPKSGMEGKTTQTERWGNRAYYKWVASRKRRRQAKEEINKQLEDK